MDWKNDRQAARGRSVGRYDRSAAEEYDHFLGLGTLSAEMQSVLLADLQCVCTLPENADVLDVGAGTGAMCAALIELPVGAITALEPSPSMLERLKTKPKLKRVKPIVGSCDHDDDRALFADSSFDVITSRKVVSSLFDPLAAFRNWHHWLRAGGHVVIIDGLFGRDSYVGDWTDEVDVLPLSASQSMATIPYLLESVGFTIESVQMTHHWNQTARTPHYIVVATKAATQ
ncbi:methyltransferase domain-containing protein [Stieleria sp. ICT_E10.1]|uniref:class I SAM-dependent methyltransferase n=1 Tax=Stieleria sedimenti TaxID=2976331 RepID=UPI002180882C|nr:class I SAM-dependent methyltransferase [Stieleria sedimenti]MCS7465699.1 methyltransferase domain-containing protein [Stieleria sedimenti]